MFRGCKNFVAFPLSGQHMPMKSPLSAETLQTSGTLELGAGRSATRPLGVSAAGRVVIRDRSVGLGTVCRVEIPRTVRCVRISATVYRV